MSRTAFQAYNIYTLTYGGAALFLSARSTSVMPGLAIHRNLATG